MPILQYRIDNQLARLLAKGSQPSEAALSELVDNAWNANAETMRIGLPTPMSQGPTVIAPTPAARPAAGPRPESPSIPGAALK